MLQYYNVYSKNIENASFSYILSKTNTFLNNVKFQASFDSFSYDYLLSYFINLEIVYGYRLLMETPLVKFKISFPFGRLSFLDYKPMLEIVFGLMADKIRLQHYMQRIINFDFFFKLFNNIYINLYFLKDFYNFNNRKFLMQHYRILTFYDKIVSIIFMNLDPFFFKYF